MIGFIGEKKLTKRYEFWGFHAYLTVLLFTYSCGVFIFRRIERDKYFNTVLNCKNPLIESNHTLFCAEKPKLIRKNNPNVAMFTVNGAGVFRYSQLRNSTVLDVSVGSISIDGRSKSNNFGKLVVLASEMIWKISNFSCVVYFDRDIQKVDETRVHNNCQKGKNMVARSGGTHYISIADRTKFLEYKAQMLLEGKEMYDETYINENKEWFEWDDGDITVNIMCYRYVARRRQCVNGIQNTRRNKTCWMTILSFALIFLYLNMINAKINSSKNFSLTEHWEVYISLFIFFLLLNLIHEFRIDGGHMRQVTTRDGNFLVPVEFSEYNYYYSKKINMFFSTVTISASLEQSALVVLFVRFISSISKILHLKLQNISKTYKYILSS